MSAIAHSIPAQASFAKNGRVSLFRTLAGWLLGSKKPQVRNTTPERIAPIAKSRVIAASEPAVLHLSDAMAEELTRALRLSQLALKNTLRSNTSYSPITRRDQPVRPAHYETPERDYPIV